MTHKAKILIVDDNLKNLQVVGAILKANDYKIVVAKDGRGALQILQKVQPDLILLDIMMPEMDGFEVCRQIKSSETLKSIPIIFLSAKTSEKDIVEGFSVGGVDYVTKPFNVDELLARVKTHVELKLSRDLIAQQTNDLKEAAEIKAKMYSIIAHDLRGPLGSFRSMLDMITDEQNTVETEQLLEFMDLLKNSANETFDLLENLLYWAKSQNKEISRMPEKFAVSEVVSQNISLLANTANSKHIMLASVIDDDIVIFADKNMITTIFRNLISNAIKFTPENGNIVVNAVKSVDMIEFAVVDSGIGMSAENMKKLFTDKEHFTTYGTQNEKGSGLGLKLCKEFVEANGGKIWAESMLGQGSQFKFTIPLKDK